MRKSALAMAIAIAAALALPGATWAQYGPRKGGSMVDSRLPPLKGEAAAPRASPVVPDPMAALERELPSLRIDLKITPSQAALWESFERETRDIAEMGRQRLKHPLQPLDASEKSPAAPSLVGRWADEDRSRADAMADLRRKLDALYQVLSEEQRREFDRRIYLSQIDPLGTVAGTPGEGRRRPPSPSR